jgi:competence ComEA-like helix-hairpin-helix protein
VYSIVGIDLVQRSVVQSRHQFISIRGGADMVTRWMSVAAVAIWCLTGGAAMAEDKPDKPTRVRADSKDVKVNINEASKTELMKLAGVGPGGAQKIIEYREAHGPFKKAQELEKVDGIGKGVVEKNAGRITVK